MLGLKTMKIKRFASSAARRSYGRQGTRCPPPAAWRFVASALTAISLGMPGIATAADLTPPVAAAPYDWTGFHVGAHLGEGWASSSFQTPDAAGRIDLQRTLNTFDEAGSFFGGLQAGYDHMFANRLVLGVEADASFPAFPNLDGYGIGGQAQFVSPTRGPQTYSDNLLTFGTVRGRFGYAPGNWLFYATGGFAWSRDQLGDVVASNGATDYPYQWRVGYSAGAGVEVPIAPHWTGRLEYLFTDFGKSGRPFDASGQRIASNLSMSEARVGLNYRPGDAAASTGDGFVSNLLGDRVAFHAQATEVAQGYPAFRSPYAGDNSLPGHAQADQTTDVTLYAGLRLWKGAEFWIDPELDQGFGLGNTHGAAGFPSGESYKLGKSYPYARVQRYLVRDTIDLGGASQDVDADINQFAGKQSANRLVVTVGKLSVADIFDTNKYANNPKQDFLNWSLINAGTFDYAGDAWGFSYGASAELYVDRFAVRAGLFDLSQTPAGGADNASSYGLDPTFRQVQALAEVEERHDVAGQPGKLKLTGFLSLGRAGSFADALALNQQTGLDASDALGAVRHYQSRPGVSLNLEQQVSEQVGVFARIGYSDGNVEPWDFTDIDRTLSGGVAISGKSWGRPDDTLGVAGVLNGIAPDHAAYFAAGGDGILIGDGQLPTVRLERIFESYYSISLTPAAKLGLDFQYIDNPAYNPQRGPVAVGAVRLHVQY